MPAYLHPHAIEELEFGDSPRLWDATPGVCCAAFQLGACSHTEADQDDTDDVLAEFPVPPLPPRPPADDLPF